MARIDDLLAEALKQLPTKPSESAPATDKKRYSELISQKVALAIADELRQRGLSGSRPAGEGELGDSGAERRMAGGLGAKKVDVTWATEESGLLFAISVKTINFRDSKTKNFQKNLVNRRGDMLMEAMTLHRRFPYAVLGAFFFLDKGAESDHTKTRRSTFLNAHARLQLFTGRSDPAGREEQFEKFYVLLLEASPSNVEIRAYEVGKPDVPVSLEVVLDDLLRLVAQRNPDFYEFVDGKLAKAS
ncbi:hypothetical protein [Paraburkholderia silvatlantica]|uniref:hypothetical protein n=1 Tax=Paraburkholderia silvatlantica TaxID=321895 RepID=UPI001AD82DBD|nr:hypothetical protein [Paraburkholderia silvatlantica]